MESFVGKTVHRRKEECCSFLSSICYQGQLLPLDYNCTTSILTLFLPLSLPCTSSSYDPKRQKRPTWLYVYIYITCNIRDGCRLLIRQHITIKSNTNSLQLSSSLSGIKGKLMLWQWSALQRDVSQCKGTEMTDRHRYHPCIIEMIQCPEKPYSDALTHTIKLQFESHLN